MYHILLDIPKRQIQVIICKNINSIYILFQESLKKLISGMDGSENESESLLMRFLFFKCYGNNIYEEKGIALMYQRNLKMN
jgi:hypothetical protein